MLVLLVENFGWLRHRIRANTSNVGIGAHAQHFRIRAHGEVPSTGMNVNRSYRLNIFDRSHGNEGRRTSDVLVREIIPMGEEG